MAEIVGAIIGAVLSAIVTWQLVTRGIVKSDLGQKNMLLSSELNKTTARASELETQVRSATGEVERLTVLEQKYGQVRARLKASSVVKTYNQPVILLGPRFVGKTSLLTQWHSPWDHRELTSTATHSIATVPIYDFDQSGTEPHFADPDILIDVKIHLQLRVHDFPGELSAQAGAAEEARRETDELRRITKKALGVVLICMFDASEAVCGVEQSTNSYYNGDLFAHLKDMVSYRNVDIQRLILVFNKYDLLRASCPGEDSASLLTRCVETFRPVLSPLRGVCNPEKVCEIFTIFDRKNMVSNNQGAPIVLGEACRGFVHAIAGAEVADELITQEATTYAASIFL